MGVVSKKPGRSWGRLGKRGWGKASHALIHLVLLSAAMLFLFPLLWMVSTSLKPIAETMKIPPVWLYWPPQFKNFWDAVNYIPFLRYTLNTLIVCSLAIIGTVSSCSLVAYGFSRIKWPGRDIFFVVTLATMMIPFPVIMVPLYAVFRELGWIGSLKPLWAPAFFGSAFNIFLLRQFFLGIPNDLSDAARIDGCNELVIFWRIILPLCKPVLAVVTLFTFIYHWNDFLAPLIFLTKQETFTLSLGLQFYQSQHGGTQWHMLMAASVLVVAPVIVLFFFTQRTFIKGIALTGIKG